jgi:hypothetical protein
MISFSFFGVFVQQISLCCVQQVLLALSVVERRDVTFRAGRGLTFFVYDGIKAISKMIC